MCNKEKGEGRVGATPTSINSLAYTINFIKILQAKKISLLDWEKFWIGDLVGVYRESEMADLILVNDDKKTP